jgi:hypothetical protein
VPKAAHCPPELLGVAFRGADSVAAGLLSRTQLRHPMWVRLLHGVYAHRDHVAAPGVRLHALALASPPGHVVCGRTAAWLHGVWRPRPGVVVPLEVTKPLATTGVRVTGQYRRRLELRRPDGGRARYRISVLDEDVVLVGDLPVTSPLRTCFDLMRERRLVEAVVVADAFLAMAAVHLEHLAAYCADRGRWPGVRDARVAVSLASGAARSPGESRLRMVLVLGGFEEPLVNVPVVDAYGQHVATPDLQVRGRTWAWLEYDGAYHEDTGQRAADLRRENRLATVSHGVPLLRYDRLHLLDQGPEQVLVEVARATHGRQGAALDLRDFRRPTPSRSW